MGKKKILMIHNYYQIGGGEHTVFQNEVDMLLKNGHEVVTYTRSNDELKSSKLKLLLLPFTTVWSFKSYFQVKKIIRENSINVVHCHNTFPLISPSVYYAARSLKIPVIQTVHNFRFLCPAGIFYCNGHICEECRKNGNFKEAIKNKCYRNSKLQTCVVVAMLKFHRFIGTYNKISYIFLTEFNRFKFDQLIDITNKDVYIKPNFVNRISVDVGINTKEIKFVFAGRLEENKGVDFLLKVWPELPKYYKLHIYGDGTRKALVERASKNYENIKYYGFKSKNEIFKDLSKAVALLFPSNLYEGFPMIISEAFSIGKPVLSTNIGNQKDIVISAKSGIVFSCNDTNEFIKGITKIIENNSIYSENAQKYFDKYLNEEYNYKRLVDIYEKARHID